MDFLAQLANDVFGSSVNYISQRMDQVLSVVLESEVFQTLLSYFEAIGAVMCVVYFLLELMNATATDNFNLEGLFFGFMKLLLGFIIITNLSGLINGMMDFEMAFTEEIFNVYTKATAGETKGIITYLLKNMSSGQSVAEMMLEMGVDNVTGEAPGILYSIVGLGYSMILQVLLLYLSMSRAIKMSYRVSMCPIAIADIYRNGTASSGFRQLKGILALFLQTPVILVLCILIEISCDITALPILFSGIIALFLIWGSLKKSEEYAKQIVGIG